MKCLQAFKKLQNLDVRDNKIEKIEEIDYIKDLNLLRDLRVEGNKLCDVEESRLTILNSLQQLEILDGIEVTAEEKIKAINYFGADLEERKKILEKYFGMQAPE